MSENGIHPPWQFRPRQTIWYYIVGRSREGRIVLIGPESTSKVANEKGFQVFDGVFEVYELPTKDRARATSMLKAKLLDQSGDLSQALKPIQHTIEETK